ncbi:hypothetical protein, partial [Enterobacter intestinihominis]
IASEPLAPGRVAPDLPGLVSTNYLNLLEKKPANTYKTRDPRNFHHSGGHRPLTAEGVMLDIIHGPHDPSTAIQNADYHLYSQNHLYIIKKLTSPPKTPNL